MEATVGHHLGRKQPLRQVQHQKMLSWQRHQRKSMVASRPDSARAVWERSRTEGEPGAKGTHPRWLSNKEAPESHPRGRQRSGFHFITSHLRKYTSKTALKEKLCYLKTLFAASSIPGLRVLFSFHYWARRLIWLLVCATVGRFMFWELGYVVEEFMERRHIVSEAVSDGSEGIMFPAITVCNLNPVRKSQLCDMQNWTEHFSSWQNIFCNTSEAEVVVRSSVLGYPLAIFHPEIIHECSAS